jgi:putative FmdB family regulatory protein
MPLYEYWCRHCQGKVTLYVRGFSSTASALCPNCGGSNMRRLFSTFSVRKTDKDVYEDILTDSQLVKGMMQNDPRALVEWNKRMSRGMDEEIAPEYEEMMDRMEAGEWPSDLMEETQEKTFGEME